MEQVGRAWWTKTVRSLQDNLQNWHGKPIKRVWPLQRREEWKVRGGGGQRVNLPNDSSRMICSYWRIVQEMHLKKFKLRPCRRRIINDRRRRGEMGLNFQGPGEGMSWQLSELYESTSRQPDFQIGHRNQIFLQGVDQEGAGDKASAPFSSCVATKKELFDERSDWLTHCQTCAVSEEHFLGLPETLKLTVYCDSPYDNNHEKSILLWNG